MRNIVSELAADRDHLTGDVDEIAVAAFAPAIHESGPCQFGKQLADFPRHVPMMLAGASTVKFWRIRECSRRERLRPQNSRGHGQRKPQKKISA